MLTRRPSPLQRRARPQRGLSIIELLVGVAVGLIVVGGAIGLFIGNLGGSRQVLAETRLNQDLRAAVDLVTRDLRRAGYWGHAIQGTIAIGAGAATAVNPYRAAATLSATEIGYNYSRDDLAAENDTLDATDQFGLRLNAGALEMQTGTGTWTPLTDASSVTITGFTITPTETTLPLGHLCPTACAIGTPNCPTTSVRTYAIVVQGQSVRDATLRRTLRSDVRVRNDRLEGVCPA